MNTTSLGLLTLIAPRSIEDDLVDFFLDSEHPYGFTSQHVRGHSSTHTRMSAVEQVTGRQQQIQFQIFVDETAAREICARMESSFPGTGINYWYLSGSFFGRIA